MNTTSTGGAEALAYTVREAQPRSGLGRNAFYRAVEKGDIPSIKIGGKILIPKGPCHRMFGAEAA
jgi:excisionase family DNA binding protein